MTNNKFNSQLLLQDNVFDDVGGTMLGSLVVGVVNSI